MPKLRLVIIDKSTDYDPTGAREVPSYIAVIGVDKRTKYPEGCRVDFTVEDGLVRQVCFEESIKFREYLGADTIDGILENARSIREILKNLVEAEKTSQIEIEIAGKYMFWRVKLELKEPVKASGRFEKNLLNSILESARELPELVKRTLDIDLRKEREKA